MYFYLSFIRYLSICARWCTMNMYYLFNFIFNNINGILWTLAFPVKVVKIHLWSLLMKSRAQKWSLNSKSIKILYLVEVFVIFSHWKSAWIHFFLQSATHYDITLVLLPKVGEAFIVPRACFTKLLIMSITVEFEFG